MSVRVLSNKRLKCSVVILADLPRTRRARPTVHVRAQNQAQARFSHINMSNYFASLDVEEEAPAKSVAAPKAAAAKSAPASSAAPAAAAGDDGPAR